MALLYENMPADESSGASSPSATPRRSTRVQKRDESGGLRPMGKTQKPSQGLQSNGRPEGTEKISPRSLSTRIKRSNMTDPENVDQAVATLRKMESDLHDNIQQQKRMVDESIVSAPTIEGSAFFPRPMETDEPSSISPETEKKGLDQLYPVVKGKEDVSGPTPLAGGDPEDRDLFGVPEETDANLIKQEGARPPPVNSDYLPLPWKGRLGYACLNTYLRQANVPVFSSRTCRISSILDHRHPLQDPSQPEHATKNRPDKSQPADVARGQRYVEALGLANARDIIKMIKWNDKYGIKFLRLSSEMFPFASHAQYGYSLEPFAAETLAEAGKLAAELGHRLTTHPGQFTQLGSPRPEVIKSAIRDLEYHDEMLSLLRLPEQENRDAVMIIHLGGVFGDKQATLARFRENYKKLPAGVKARLVLENDDVSWSVHDLLPLCEELNIPLVLDFHHHNIIFDPDQIREGTKDIMDLYPRIRATWDRKRITQKMHYSESCPNAVTRHQRRKHSPRVMTLPPCPPDMDLMIEAKDKEQAVLTLMRNFRLPGHERINDIVPYERDDDNRPPPKLPAKKQPKKKKPPRKKAKKSEDPEGDEEEAIHDEEPEPEEPPPPPPPAEVPEAEISMGGPLNRVFWPVGMEEWLRPRKREVKRKLPVTTEEEGSEDEDLAGSVVAALSVKAEAEAGAEKVKANIKATRASKAKVTKEAKKAKEEAKEPVEKKKRKRTTKKKAEAEAESADDDDD